VAEHIRKAVQTELGRQLGRPVSIRSASLTVTGGVVLKGVVIKNPDGSVLLKATEMQARVGGLKSLLRGKTTTIQVQSVRLKSPELNLARRPDGTLTISDLLARTSQAPSAFRGTVRADNAHITFVDETRGGQVTSIANADVTFKQPTQDRVTFTVRAGANEGAFQSLELQGESDRTTKTTKLQGEAARLSLPFTVERIPGLTALTAAGGTADVKGKLSFCGDPGKPELTYDATADVNGAEVSFPWLRRPAKGVEGRLRLAEGALRLDGVKGTVENAPVELSGTISDLTRPVFALDLSVTGIRYPQLRALFPRVALPAGLLLPSAMRVNAKIEGPADQIKVSGEATVKVIKFHAIPWHDLVGRFEYQDGRLKISSLRGHGSPRQFEADIEIDLTPHGPKAQGSLALANMPLSMLAEMAGIKGEFQGTVRANVRGAIQDGGELQGDFVVDDAVVQGAKFGKLAGEFIYRDGGVILRRVRIRGPAADGVFDADISRSGSYTLAAHLASLDLTKLGPMAKVQGLRGQCRARIEASGQVKAGQATARVRLGPGELQGQPFDSLSANLTMTRDRVIVRELVAEASASRARGDITITGWRLPPERAKLSGRVEVAGIALKDRLPKAYEKLALEGTLGGAFDISGTLAQPAIVGDIVGDSVIVANHFLPTARARLRYQKRALIIEQIGARSADDSIALTGGYTPEAGFAIELEAKGMDLSQIVPDSGPWVGFALHGLVNVHAHVSGPLDEPVVEFDGRAYGSAAAPLDANGVPFDELTASGRLVDGALEVHSSLLRWNSGSVSFSGTVDTRAQQLVGVSAILTNMDLGSLLRVGDAALWRLYERNKTDPVFRSPFVRRYAMIPRPLTGRLTANADCSGSLAEPRIDTTLELADFGFDTRTIQRIAGDVDVTLGIGPGRQVAVHHGTVNLTATQRETEASLTGKITPDGQVALDLETGNLDLELVNPWLQLPAELGGQAKIDATITGPLAQPVIRGGAFVDKLQVGTFPVIESASVDPIWLRGGVLDLDDIRLRNGPMEATGSATIPVAAALFSTANMYIAEASFAAVEHMVPAKFTAYLHLDNGTVYLRDGTGPGGPDPGIQGTLGSGRFSVGGYIRLWQNFQWQPAFHVTARLDDAEVSIPGLFDVTLAGIVSLKNESTGRPLLTTEQGEPPTHQPLVVSKGTVTLEQTQGIRARLGGIFVPKLDVRLAVGQDIWFQRGSSQRATRIRIDPARTAEDGTRKGYLDIGGAMRAADVTLDGEFESHEGRLAFPNGVLSLRSGTARVTREAGKKPVVMVTAEAEGRVGDYLVSLNPSGQIYPSETAAPAGTPPPLALNLTSLPSLEEGYVLALLEGPIVTPSLGTRPDITSLLAQPTGEGGTGGQVTGIRLPPFGNQLGMQELSLEVALAGPVQLRVGQRVLKRLVVSYVSTLSGPVESRRLRFSYEVTPRYSIGWSVNELNEGRSEINAFIPF
jgi:hypothetical protein